MSLHRFKCRLRFTAASGMGPWARDQMAVRHAMAVHINEGAANEELKRHQLTDDGDHQIYECDLPLLDESHAASAYDTMATLKPWIESDDVECFIEHHVCYHDETPVKPCVIVRREVL